MTIAWLHFLQPFARLYGRLRGMLHRPAGCAASVPGRRSRTDAGLGVADVMHGLRLCLRLPVEKAYWSERWIDLAILLRAIADRLRQKRAVRHIELDSGWWEDRDLTIVDRSWFRLDLRALVEEHGGGRCLYRFAMRSRVTSAGALPLLFLLLAIVGLDSAALVPWPVASAVLGVLAVAMAVRDMATTCGVVTEALRAVEKEFGIAAIPLEERRARAAQSIDVKVTPPDVRLVTQEATPDPGASLVGDL